MTAICTEPYCGAVAVGRTGLCAAHFAGFELDLDDAAGMAEREEQARWAEALVETLGLKWYAGMVCPIPGCPGNLKTVAGEPHHVPHHRLCPWPRALRAVGLA